MMILKRILPLLVLLLSACAPTLLGTPVPTSSPSPQVISTRLTALLIGTLVDESGCLRVQSELTPTTYTLVWPPEYTVQRDGSTIMMTDGVGKVTTWRFGQHVRLGGGESGYDDQCPAPYWVVGDVSPGEDVPTPQPSQALSVFPLSLETQWTYLRDDYDQAPGDPSQLLHAKTQIVETVVDKQEASGVKILHIQGQQSMLEADPGWAEGHPADLNEYEYWYVVLPDSIYRSETQPNPDSLQLDPLKEEYKFPMVVGSAWCPAKAAKGEQVQGTETPLPCEYTGKRSVEQAGPYPSQAGSFDRCYQLMDSFNSGNIIRWFCDGVGLVAVKYDHMGTRFGFTQELVSFKSGAGSGSDKPSSTSAPSSVGTESSSTGEAQPSFSKSYPNGLLVEEYALKAPPQVDSMFFDPIQSTSAAILKVHQRERSERYVLDLSYGVDGLLYPSTGRGRYAARTSFDSNTGTQKAIVQVLEGNKIIFKASAGDASPVDPLQGLWEYGEHWVLEYAHITLSEATPGVIDSNDVGQIVLDGVSINQRDDLQEAFGFQLIQGQPFYFYKMNNQIGASFAGENLDLSYDEIPHYGCCSYGVLNPIHAQKMIAFFARRAETWYYVEIGMYA